MLYNTPVIFTSTDYASALQQAKVSVQEILQREGHPDFVEMQPEGKTYLKEQIVEFLSDVPLAPYEGPYKVYLFHHAEKMLPVHANALLKAFEEKPQHAVILCVTDNINSILGTLLSRSKKIAVPQKGEPVLGNSDKVKEALMQVAKKDLYACMETIGHMEEIDLEVVTQVIFSWYRDLHLLQQGVAQEHLLYPETANLPLQKLPTLEEIQEWIEMARIAAERHMRPKLILEYLFLHFL